MPKLLQELKGRRTIFHPEAGESPEDVASRVVVKVAELIARTSAAKEALNDASASEESSEDDPGVMESQEKGK